MSYSDNCNQRNAWDQEYRKKGRLWGNAPIHPINPSGKIILDLGTGDGKNLRNRTNCDQDIIGIDFSISALTLLKKESGLQGIPLVCADACYLPISKCSIDFAYLHHLLGHLLISDRIHLIEEVNRVLRPGGRVIVTVFGKGDMRDGKGTLVEEGSYIRGQGIITHYFSEEEMMDLFRGGWRHIHTDDVRYEMRIGKEKYIRRQISAIFEKN